MPVRRLVLSSRFADVDDVDALIAEESETTTPLSISISSNYGVVVVGRVSDLKSGNPALDSSNSESDTPLKPDNKE